MTRAEEILLKEMRYIASISNGQVKRVAEGALASVSAYLATEPSGERAELIAELKLACIDGTLSATLVNKAADMLEADANLRKQFARRTVERDMAISMLSDALEADAQQAKPTGWDNGLSQDYCAEFGQWLASRPGARQQIKEMFSSNAPK